MSYIPFGGVWRYSERAAVMGPKATGIGVEHARRAVASVEALMLALDHAIECKVGVLSRPTCQLCQAAGGLLDQLRGRS